MDAILTDSNTPCMVLEIGFYNTTQHFSMKQSSSVRDWAKISRSYSLSPFWVAEKVWF